MPPRAAAALSLAAAAAGAAAVAAYLRRHRTSPLDARIEVIQGPNNNKQVIELYSEDGFDRPMFFLLPTPGPGNVVRIVNNGPMEFPLTAGVVPNHGRGAAPVDLHPPAKHLRCPMSLSDPS